MPKLILKEKGLKGLFSGNKDFECKVLLEDSNVPLALISVQCMDGSNPTEFVLLIAEKRSDDDYQLMETSPIDSEDSATIYDCFLTVKPGISISIFNKGEDNAKV